MRELIAAPGCACLSGTVLPATRAELMAQGAEQLDLGLGEPALLGTCFDEALVLTSNAGALIEAQGGYGPLQRCGDLFRLTERRAGIRVDDWRCLPVLRTAAGDSIAVIALDGRVQHRIHLAGHDREIARTLPVLVAMDHRPAAQQPEADRSNIVSLAAIRDLRLNWHQRTDGTQVDEIIRNRGCGRLVALPAMGQRARKVRPGLIGGFLDFICRQREPIRATVAVDGMAHSLGGVIETVQHLGPMILCLTSAGRFAMDPHAIAEIWATRHGRRAGLEIYAPNGQSIALLGGAQDRWAEFIEAYPPA